MTIMSTEVVAKAMKLVVTVAAAKADANDDQVKQLKTRLLPYMQSSAYIERGRTEPIWAMLKDIMGAEWAPTGEYAEQLAVL